MTEIFDKLDIEYVPPKANFVMLIFPDEDFAAEFTKGCYENGVLVRHVIGFGIPNGVRISTGNIKETEYAIKVFETVYISLKEKYEENKIKNSNIFDKL